MPWHFHNNASQRIQVDSLPTLFPTHHRGPRQMGDPDKRIILLPLLSLGFQSPDSHDPPGLILPETTASLKTSNFRSPHYGTGGSAASWEHWDAGLILGQAQWVKDSGCHSCSLGLQLQLGSDPWPGNSICLEVPPRQKKKSSNFLVLGACRQDNFRNCWGKGTERRAEPSICNGDLWQSQVTI